MTERERVMADHDKAIESARRLGVVILAKVPDGWRSLGALMQPRGTYWVGHGSLFDGTHERTLVWDKWMLNKMHELGVEVDS